MLQRTRLVALTVVLLLCAVVGAFTATQGFVPKYDAAGALVDSAIYESGGNVGVGTTTPGARLDVNGYVFVRSRLRFPTTGNWAEIYSPQDEGPGVSPIQFSVGAGDALRITNSGNVGVGTTTPTAKLHVAGNMTVNGNIAAKYQDVAEWVPTTETMHAGSVVSLDLTRPNHVRASRQEYDSAVAGVVSTQPGVVLGEPGPSKALIATTGRVSVRADASRAPIAIGDLLVTSDKQGLAMKSIAVEVGSASVHRVGTILGKALESLPSGQGQILVLLSLQ